MNMNTGNLEKQAPGLVGPVNNKYAKVVDRHVLHGPAMDFQTLCLHAVKQDTKYLVLDLDGTFHRGLNLGVLLGWELSAYQAYGLDFLLKAEKTRGPGAMILDRTDHAAQRRYALAGGKRWALPGAIYYGLARLGWKKASIRKQLRKKMGPHAMDSLLGLMRLNLMHHLAQVPEKDVKKLVFSLWRRYAEYQVIDPQDIAWLKKTFPNLTIIVSSASPKVCLEPVRRDFPVHDVINTDIEFHDGFTSSPHVFHPVLEKTSPRRIAPPKTFTENASYEKISNLLERYPDFLDEGVHTVGITDTKHGEDACWSEYFKTVADINSPDPFFPIVSSRSSLQEIHSAKVKTRKEKSLGALGQAGASRPGRSRTLEKPELERLLKKELEQTERSALACYCLLLETEPLTGELEEKMVLLKKNMEHAVALYNQAPEQFRASALSALLLALKKSHRLEKTRALLLKPMAQDWSKIEQAGERALERLHDQADLWEKPGKREKTKKAVLGANFQKTVI